MLIQETLQNKMQPTDLTSVESRKALKSKIESVSIHIESLLQKKYRIDLEIKRQKKHLKKLRDLTKRVVSESLEQHKVLFEVDEIFNPLLTNQLDLLQQELNSEEYNSLIELDRAYDDLVSLITEINQLHLD